MNRLTTESVVGGYTHQYAYDLVGNRLSIIKNGAATYYFYDERDRLRKECSDAAGTNVLAQYDYDANGSTTSKSVTGGNTTVYGYNLQNRLASVTLGSTPCVTYQYNPSGIRTQKAVDGGDTMNYLIDPQNQTGYAQVLEQTVSDGINPDEIMFFVLGYDVIGQAADSADVLYLLYDGHGSVRQGSDASGVPTAAYNYDAYGNADGFAPTDGLYYTGEMYDTAIEGYYLRAREYTPRTGTFVTSDPYPGNQYDPQSLHKYLYCHANPVNASDPSGRFALMTMPVMSAGEVLVRKTEVPKTLVIGKVASTVMFAALGYEVATGIDNLTEALERHETVSKIQEFVQGHQTIPLTQTDFDDLDDGSKRSIYLHYSFRNQWESLLKGLDPAGVRNPEGSYATKTVYPTGWTAKWFLALDGSPRNAIYVVYPRKGFSPTYERYVRPNEEGMGGGGYEYVFGNGSGGIGTVFGPIPIPEGFEGDWN